VVESLEFVTNSQQGSPAAAEPQWQTEVEGRAGASFLITILSLPNMLGHVDEQSAAGARGKVS